MLIVVIFLIIVVIIGLIVFKYQNGSGDISSDVLENFIDPIDPIDPIDSTDTTILSTTIPSRIIIDSTATIMNNNKEITKLIDDIQNKVPSVNLINYNSNEIYKLFQDKVNTNINQLDSVLGNTNMLLNRQRIDKLENNIIDMEKLVKNLGLENQQSVRYNKIKSLNNGMEIGLTRTPNTYFLDARTGSNSAAYMVNINDGCLSVGANDYDVYKCNDTNSKQFFKMENILNSTAYGANLDTSLPADVSSNLSSINYPFVMLKSINTDNCLTNNHGSITVQPCYTFEAQRWFPLEI